MRYLVQTFNISGRKIFESEHDTPEDSSARAIHQLNEWTLAVEIRIIDRERQKHQG